MQASLVCMRLARAAAWRAVSVRTFSAAAAGAAKPAAAAKPPAKPAPPPKAEAAAAPAAVDAPVAELPKRQRPTALTTVDVPAKGPLGVAGAFRRVPTDPTKAMMATNLQQAYANLVFLCGHKLPPRESVFLKVLEFVKSGDDMETANKALNVCINKGLVFTPRATNAWANVCIKTGVPERAVETIVDYRRTRLFPQATSSARLLNAVAAEGKEEPFKAMQKAMWYYALHKRMSPTYLGYVVKAYNRINGNVRQATGYATAAVDRAQSAVTDGSNSKGDCKRVRRETASSLTNLAKLAARNADKESEAAREAAQFLAGVLEGKRRAVVLPPESETAWWTPLNTATAELMTATGLSKGAAAAAAESADAAAAAAAPAADAAAAPAEAAAAAAAASAPAGAAAAPKME